MVQQKDPRLKTATVRARYDNPANYKWEDPWHNFTGAEINHYVTQFCLRHLRSEHVVLHAGAGDIELKLGTRREINLDISETRVARQQNAIVANVEELPLSNRSIDIVICVGSVINYCDATATIAEFSRVLRPSGYLLLEFESSRSAEFSTQDAYARSAAVVETFYGNDPETIWVYLPEFIGRVLEAAGFKITRKIAIHVLSPWVLLLFDNIPMARRFAQFDRLVQHVPLLTRWASNHLFICEKR